MLVEHEFITTLDADAALARAELGLAELGFLRVGVFDPLTESRPCAGCGYDLKGIDMKLPCPECGMRPHLARRVEFSKGVKNPRKSMFALETDPQRVFVEFDRGKVTVAAAVESYRKAEKLHSEMMVLVATHTERAVRDNASGESPEWQELMGRIKKRNRRKRLPQRIVIGVLVLIIAAVIVGIALST